MEPYLTEQQVRVFRVALSFNRLQLAYIGCDKAYPLKIHPVYRHTELLFRSEDVAALYRLICSETEMDSLSNERAQALLRKINVPCRVFPINETPPKPHGNAERYAVEREPLYECIIQCLLKRCNDKPSPEDIQAWVKQHYQGNLSPNTVEKRVKKAITPRRQFAASDS